MTGPPTQLPAQALISIKQLDSVPIHNLFHARAMQFSVPSMAKQAVTGVFCPVHGAAGCRR